MKRIAVLCTFTTIALVLFLLLMPFTTFANELNDGETWTTYEADEVEVSGAVSLLTAIRSNRTIRLLPGDYDLSSDAVIKILQDSGAAQFPNVFYSVDIGTYNGIVLSDVYNLRIIADSPQEIYTKNISDTVLIFQECSHITLSGITLGHKPEKASTCSAGVVVTSYCNNIAFNGCDLYGCGYEGAGMICSSSIAFTDCIIRDCSDNAAYMENVVDIKFVGTDVYGNGTESEYATELFWVSGESRNITFQKCSIHDNGNTNTSSPSTMFRVDWANEELTITNCEMDNNLYDAVIN